MLPYAYTLEQLDNYDTLYAIGENAIESLAAVDGTKYRLGSVSSFFSELSHNSQNYWLVVLTVMAFQIDLFIWVIFWKYLIEGRVAGSSFDWMNFNLKPNVSYCYEMRPAGNNDGLGQVLPDVEIIKNAEEVFASIVAILQEAIARDIA